MTKRVITRNGMTVDCYGEWQEDSNCVVCGETANGMELEAIWADGAENWEDAVNQLTAWAVRHKYIIEELQAC